ncbi:MAG: TetR/AcrR family transcriptional regulator [Mycobacterium leprae]
MARTKGAQGEESRKRLLQAAAHEFATRGYDRATISGIAAGAGLTQGAFYLYFASKEAVYAELVAVFRERIENLVQKIDPYAGLPVAEVSERQQAGLEAVFRFLTDDPDLTRVVLQSPEGEALRRALALVISKGLRAAQAAGYYRGDLAVDVVSECLVGIVERLVVRWGLNGEQEPTLLAGAVSDFVLWGMAASRPDGSPSSHYMEGED